MPGRDGTGPAGTGGGMGRGQGRGGGMRGLRQGGGRTTTVSQRVLCLPAMRRESSPPTRQTLHYGAMSPMRFADGA